VNLVPRYARFNRRLINTLLNAPLIRLMLPSFRDDYAIAADLYDYFVPNANCPDLAFYVDEAMSAGGRILEPACGTGRVRIPTARPHPTGRFRTLRRIFNPVVISAAISTHLLRKLAAGNASPKTSFHPRTDKE